MTTTVRVGDQDGGSNGPPPYRGVFPVSANHPISITAGFSGDILNVFTFTFKSGANTGQLGGHYSGGSPFSFSDTGEMFSRIHIDGLSTTYGSADRAVFEFKYEQTQTANLEALERLYVGSASGVTLKDLAARCVTRPIVAFLLNAAPSVAMPRLQTWPASSTSTAAARCTSSAMVPGFRLSS